MTDAPDAMQRGAQPPVKKSGGCMSPGFACFTFLVGALLLAAIAIPSMIGPSRIIPNETAAVAALRTYVAAQETFIAGDLDGDGVKSACGPANARFPDYTHLHSAAGRDGEPLRLIPANMAAAKLGAAGATPRAGYWFADIAADSDGQPYDPKTRYGLCAVPAEYDVTGRKTFVVDDSGTVWQKDNGGQPVGQFPDVDDPASGWEAYD